MAGSVRDWSREEQSRAAVDPATPQWQLSELADSEFAEVRLAVASHPASSDITVARLAHDPDQAVAAAAHRRAAPRPAR